MFNWIYKIFIRKQYTCCLELHNQLGCYLSLHVPSSGPIEGFQKFFSENDFLIAHKICDSNSKNKDKLEEIRDKILAVYDLDITRQDIGIIIDKEKVFLPKSKKYIKLFKDSAFIYKKNKIRVFT